MSCVSGGRTAADALYGEALERLGSAAGAGRVYVFANEALADGGLGMRLQHEWVARGTPRRPGARTVLAYDEGFARSSPGVQLMLDVTEALLADSALAETDSCATANHPMIDRLWRERLALADRLIPLRPTPHPFALACWLESLRGTAIMAAKAVRDRVRS